MLVSFKYILHKRHYKIYTSGKVKGKKKEKLYRQILTKMITTTRAIKLTYYKTDFKAESIMEHKEDLYNIINFSKHRLTSMV